jgi:rod shape-determining protein MreC
MAADHYGQYLSQVRSAITTVLEPLERIASIPYQAHEWFLDQASEQARIEKELIQLRAENLLLKSRLQRLDDVELELERLQRLLGTTGRMSSSSIRIASVLNYSATPLSQFITINKGQLDGVRPQQAVIDANGIIGQIVSATPTSARVLLISDPQHQVPVRVQRTGQRGILTGIGHDLLSLDFVPQTSEVEVGDRLVTSGLGGAFPAGYPAAEVVEVKINPGQTYLSILAKPIADSHSAYEVLVLFNTRGAE